MTALEAYDVAVVRWGDQAAVWRFPNSDRHIVGRWLPLSELVGGFVLKIERHHNGPPENPAAERWMHRPRGAPSGKALEILGEGLSWEGAFEDADARDKAIASARELR